MNPLPSDTPSGRIIRFGSDLSVLEEARLYHTLREYYVHLPPIILARKHYADRPTRMDFAMLYTLVFHDWDSQDERIDKPTLPNLVVNATGLKVGYFGQDVPETGQNLTATRPPAHRCKDAPCFMVPEVSANNRLKFVFQDANGGIANGEHVVFEGMDRDEAELELIKQRDDQKKHHILTYNRMLVCYYTRKRIIGFARRGEASKTDPIGEDSDDDIEFERLRLLEEAVMETATRDQYIVEGLAQDSLENRNNFWD